MERTECLAKLASRMIMDENKIQRDSLLLGIHGDIQIGKFTTFGRNLDLRCHDTSLIIGEDNMFSSEVRIIAGDGHNIISLITNELLTHKQPIVTGQHVWCGIGTTLLSKTNIGNGSIVGANSLVNAIVDDNVIVAGNPARVIRRDVRWERRLSLNENAF